METDKYGLKAADSDIIPSIMKNLGVRMIREDMENIPQFPIPEGFAIRNYRRDEGYIWTRIQQAAEPYINIDDGLFMREFKRDLLAMENRSFYLTTDAGEEIGTITAWWQDEEWGQIHWVAVHPDYQGTRTFQTDDVCGDVAFETIPRTLLSRHINRTNSCNQTLSRFRIYSRPYA